MFNLKNKTLVFAISVALGLSACGDNAQVSQNEIKKEAPQKLSLSEQVEQKIEAMIAKNDERRLFDGGDIVPIQQRVFELFPASNTRMEKTAENCRWYVERELIPAWSPKVPTEAEPQFVKDFGKKRLENMIPNENGEPNLKTLALIKEFFFIDGKLFDEDKLNDKVNLHTYLCMLYPDYYGYYKDDEENGGIQFGSFFYKGKDSVEKAMAKINGEVFITNQQTKFDKSLFLSKLDEEMKNMKQRLPK